MAFQKHTAVGGKFNPRITVTNRGGIGISSGMHRRYGIDDYEGVELFFDPDTNRVGMKFVRERTRESFRLKKLPGQRGASFSAGSFWAANSVNLSTYSGRYIPEEVEDSQFGKLIVITLQAHG